MNKPSSFSIPTTKPKLGYIPALNGLRAIAVVMVMMVHAHFQLGQNGQIGVAIFFALSGFLITTLLLEEFEASGSVDMKGFYIRRTFRLFPALYIMLAFVVLYAILLASADLRPQILGEALPASLYVYNIASLWGWNTGTVILGHTWSLAVEEQFYVLWPWVLYLALRIDGLRGLTIGLATFLLAMLVLRYFNTLPLAVGLIFQESIFAGCLLALLRWQSLLPKRIPESITLIILLALLFAAILPFDFPLPIFNASGIVSLVIIYAATNRQSGITTRLLSHPLLVSIGKVSYALYLWHLPIFRWFSWHSPFPSPVSFVLKIIVTFLVAYASWHLVEKYAIARGRHLSKNYAAANVKA
jgi:peptidoglycan/LPS O-acetylase OafA/YrhL